AGVLRRLRENPAAVLPQPDPALPDHALPCTVHVPPAERLARVQRRGEVVVRHGEMRLPESGHPRHHPRPGGTVSIRAGLGETVCPFAAVRLHGSLAVAWRIRSATSFASRHGASPMAAGWVSSLTAAPRASHSRNQTSSPTSTGAARASPTSPRPARNQTPSGS